MIKTILLATAALLIAAPALAAEQPVRPYIQSDANAGTSPLPGDTVFKALHGMDGIGRIVTTLMAENRGDPRIADIFRTEDTERFHRVLAEQICYISGGPCHYTGMDMAMAHKDMGLQQRDFNIVVEHLENAMNKEGVPFRDQAKLLAKLAPMKAAVVDKSQN